MPACTAPPGSYCAPDGAIFLCHESWYCPGGIYPARACPSGTWSAVGSVYVDNCQENMSAAIAIAVFLLLIAIACSLCCWYISCEPVQPVCQPPPCQPGPYYHTFRYYPPADNCYPPGGFTRGPPVNPACPI
jgi:hypothetical protein